MRTIHVQSIGPISDSGTLQITPVTLLIGEQSTGKSTLMKILCHCCWIEKRLMVGDNDTLYQYTHHFRFRRELMAFHRMNDDFFTPQSRIIYESDTIKIEMEGTEKNARITKKERFSDARHNSKLSFLPAERNLLSAVKNIEKIYRSGDYDMLFNYILEWGEAKTSFTPDCPLSLVFARDMKYFYDPSTGNDYLSMDDKHKRITPYYASSGIQSALPVAAMANYVSRLVRDRKASYSPSDYQTIAEATDTASIERLRSRFAYRAFRLFIEEPEQNLFPHSQFLLLRSIIGLLHKASETDNGEESNIVLTTHSPYILTALNLLLSASLAWRRDEQATRAAGFTQSDILPPSAYSAYRIDTDGTAADLVDDQFGFIRGDYLDSVSNLVDEKEYLLNSILYANN